MKIKPHHKLAAEEIKQWKKDHPFARTQEVYDEFDKIADSHYFRYLRSRRLTRT